MSSQCPLCRVRPKFYEEDYVLNEKRRFIAYCDCSNACVETTYMTLKGMVGDPREYFYDLAWQRWKEKVDKKSMKNPDSEETGAMGSDAIWDAVIRAMWDAYIMGTRGDDIKQSAIMEEVLKVHLNDLLDNGHPPDH